MVDWLRWYMSWEHWRQGVEVKQEREMRGGLAECGVARDRLGEPTDALLNLWPQLRQGYPLNLSILLSGGKETNQDSPSNGERTGKSPI